MKSKRKFFDGLDARWQKAYRKTVKQWAQIVKRGGWRSKDASCALCREANIRGEALGLDQCRVCILRKFRGNDCTALPEWHKLSGAALALDSPLSRGQATAAGKTRLKAAQTILCKLKDALPKRDEARVAAERILEAK